MQTEEKFTNLVLQLFKPQVDELRKEVTGGLDILGNSVATHADNIELVGKKLDKYKKTLKKQQPVLDGTSNKVELVAEKVAKLDESLEEVKLALTDLNSSIVAFGELVKELIINVQNNSTEVIKVNKLRQDCLSNLDKKFNGFFKLVKERESKYTTKYLKRDLDHTKSQNKMLLKTISEVARAPSTRTIATFKKEPETIEL